MKKTFIRLFSSVLLVMVLLSPTVLSGLRKSNVPITESFSTKATAASFLSIEDAARYASMFYEAGSSSYELAYSALTGQNEGTPETWASIAEGITFFIGVSGNIEWDNLFYDASDITTSNINHITGAISGMFDVIDSAEEINTSSNALQTAVYGVKTIKGFMDIFGVGSYFPSSLSLAITGFEVTFDIAGFLETQYFKENVTLYEMELQIEYYSGQTLTYKEAPSTTGFGISQEDANLIYKATYLKYYSKQSSDRVGGNSSGGGSSEVPVEDVSLPLSSYTIFNNQITTIVATVYPSNATNKTITYSSSDTSIATVDSEGVITPIEGMYGKVTIYATAHNGVRESCELTILPFWAVKTDDSCQIVSYIGSGGIVEIPSQVNVYKVTSIGKSAFKDNNKITKIIIPDSVINIESTAFYGCENLSEVIVGTGIKTIKKGAFYECVNLARVEINGNLESISDFTFAYCKKLSEIKLPNSIESVGESAFYNCSNLISVEFGSNVKSIGKDAFRDCVALTELTLPDSMTDINENAFSGCKQLSKVNFGTGIKNIGEAAFYGCSNLSEVTIGTEIETIGKGAFYECVNLVNVEINGNLENISDFTFAYCEKLLEITLPSSVESIGEAAFHRCSNLKSVIFGNKVSSIGSYAFFLCDALIEVTIPDSVVEIGEEAFRECISLEKLTIGTGIRKIARGAFYKCENLNTVIIKGDLEVINDYTFTGCKKLSNITIPETVVSIGEASFNACTELKSVNIGKNTESIGVHAFSYCFALTEITIPNSVVNIEDYAFYNCSSLKELTIPISTKLYNSEYVFGGCVNIEKIILTKGNGTVQNYITEYDENGEKTYVNYTPWYISGCSTIVIDDGIKEIPPNMFRSCTELTNVLIGNDVISIGRASFDYCVSLTYVKIGENVTNIDEYAFEMCVSLNNLTIPSNVTNIDKDAFLYCRDLVTIAVSEDNKYYSNDNFGVLYNKNQTELVMYPIGAKRNAYIVPDSVTIIGYRAFFECKNLQRVILGNNVSSIGNQSFMYCSGLESVEIQDSVTSIGHDAFYGCTSLTSIKIPNSVTSVGSRAFSGCKGIIELILPASLFITKNVFSGCESIEKITLTKGTGIMPDYSFSQDDETCYQNTVWYRNRDNYTEIIIEEGVTNIGNYTFYMCTGLENIAIPDSVTMIGEWAFYGCSNLTKVTIPDGVTDIGKWAFYDCININSMVFGDNIINIGNNAFNHCINLTNLSLPDSVITIGDYAFTNCISLSNVTIPKSVEQIGYFAFGGCRNISLVNYTGSKKQWESIMFFDGNDLLLNANLVYGIKVNFTTNIISGFNTGETSLDSYTTVDDNCIWKYETINGRLGTGAKAILNDGGTIIGEYTILVYGDTNGDSWYDGQDAVIVSCLANGMLTKDDVGEAVYMAADCNHDGVIDQLDVDLLNQAGTLLANVDQSKPTEVLLETSSEYVEYLELIDQTSEIEIEDEDVADAEQNFETDMEENNGQTVIPDIDTSEELTSTEFDLIKILMTLFENLFGFIRNLFLITN